MINYEAQITEKEEVFELLQVLPKELQKGHWVRIDLLSSTEQQGWKVTK